MKEMFEQKVTGKISRISLLIVALMMMFVIAGCGDKNDSKEKETTTAGSTISGSVEGAYMNEKSNGDFDFSQVFDNIEINGKKVPFPFTLNDLGEGYEFGYIVDMGDGSFGTDLMHNGKVVCSAYINSVEDMEDIGRDSFVFEIVLSSYDTEQIVKIKGLNCDNNANDVRENILGLEEKYKENKLTAMEAIKGNNHVYITFYENEYINSMYITKGEE